MNKELQDLAWSCLPKEFKEEVKRLYREFTFTREGYYKELFGLCNLISDAEEEEMLIVPRKKIQDFFMNFKREKSDAKSTFDKVSLGARMSMLHELFGSKCLPDNVDSLPQNPTENCDNKSHISADCNKPAEPKFKVGDIAVVRGFNHPLLKQDGAIVTILSYHDKGDFYSCAIAPNVGIDVDAKYLEPYTEPVNEADKYFDNILKDSFRNHNRLHIATQITASIYSNDKSASQFNSIEALVRKALDIADTLIAEVEKGAER